MIVLGVDPGTAVTGFGLIAVDKARIKPVGYGVIRTSSKDTGPARLVEIFSSLQSLLEEYQPVRVAVEQLFYNKNVQSALAVGQARGVVLLAAAKFGCEIFEYTPLQVKQSVVGYGRADKSQVQFMVGRMLGLKEQPKPVDAADALAVAICSVNSHPPGLQAQRAIPGCKD